MSYGTNNKGGGYGGRSRRSGFKGSNYKGHKLEVEKKNGQVWVRAPDITKQYIGVGKTKTEAVRDAQKSIDSLPATWNVVQDNSVTIRFRNSKTGDEVLGFKDNATMSRKWYPVKPNGDYIQELHATETKEEMKHQLEQYLKGKQ